MKLMYTSEIAEPFAAGYLSALEKGPYAAMGEGLYTEGTVLPIEYDADVGLFQCGRLVEGAGFLSGSGILYHANVMTKKKAEFPEYADKKYLIDRCHEVIRSGYSPVIAHAERCTAIRKDIGLLQRLVDMGVQIQMNAGSILGEEGLARKWFCKKAMKRGLLHYIGSDAHDMVHRRPNLGKCAAYVERIMGKEYRDMIMMVNPQKITEGSAWEDYE